MTIDSLTNIDTRIFWMDKILFRIKNSISASDFEINRYDRKKYYSTLRNNWRIIDRRYWFIDTRCTVFRLMVISHPLIHSKMINEWIGDVQKSKKRTLSVNEPIWRFISLRLFFTLSYCLMLTRDEWYFPSLCARIDMVLDLHDRQLQKKFQLLLILPANQDF